VVIVSPHVDSAGIQDLHPETSGSERVFASKSNKKEGSGLFAKLLAGLTKNLRARKGEGGVSDGADGIEGVEGAGDGVFNGVTNGVFPAGETPAAEKKPLGEGAALFAVSRPVAFRSAMGEQLSAEEAETALSPAEGVPAGRVVRKQSAGGGGDRNLAEIPAEEAGRSPMEALSPPAESSGAGSESAEAPETGIRESAVPGAGIGADSGIVTGAVSGREPLPPPKLPAGEQPSFNQERAPPVLPDGARPEAAEKGRGSGGRSASGDRRKDRMHIELRDLRGDREKMPEEALPGVDAGMPLRKAAAAGETELVVELRGGGRDMSSADSFREVRGSPYTQSFETMLARELNQSLSGDIVRHAQVLLRDGSEGTIRLTLRPETLGKVKIRLEMAENKITGHIIVESEEALKAFEREIHSLEQAFRDAGYEAAELEMSLNQGGGSERRWEGEEANPLSAKLAASRYAAEQEGALAAEASAAAAGVFYVSGGQVTVNMLI
jgi:hypothetical protein